MEPVVIALTLGMVMVGGVAWAVKGMAAPDLMRLAKEISFRVHRMQHIGSSRLSKFEARLGGVDEVTMRFSVIEGRCHRMSVNLLSASTTMNTTLSNGADANRPPSFES